MQRALASRFGAHSPNLRSDHPLSDEQIRAVAPSIFAEAAHPTRSERYTYIPTIDVLRGLRKEGFEPFMVAQTKVKDESRLDFTKHMIRLRHRSDAVAGEANEIIVLNSHDGTSGYQMLAGMFRFVCKNGLVCGDIVEDVRIRHSGNVVDDVIGSAHDILDGFGLVREVKEEMKSLQMTEPQQLLLANTAIEFKYGDTGKAPPVTPTQALQPRRYDDNGSDVWSTFNRVQENLVRGGLESRTAAGRRTRTRAVQGIDQNVKLNRALWTLADGMRKLLNGEVVAA